MSRGAFEGLGYREGLRRGYTTGSCAAAAARGALELLRTGTAPSTATIVLPTGELLTVPLEHPHCAPDFASCAVRKDSGDDPDGTDGMLIFAGVRLREGGGIVITGGPGIGRVTRGGLPVPPGEWAINPGPRAMIARALEDLLPPGAGAEVRIWAPEGEDRAKKTWNPRIGVEGGISILGTTGVVEPKSTAAWLASIDAYISSALSFDSPNPGTVFLVSGYVGERCLKERFHVPEELIVLLGDHVGHGLKGCASRGAARVYLYGHVGKWAKVAAGLFNTHCDFGDARLETVAACAGAAGATGEQIRKLLALPLAEEAVPLLQEWRLDAAFSLIARRAHERSLRLTGGSVPLGVAVLSLKGEVLGSFPPIGSEVESWTELPSSV